MNNDNAISSLSALGHPGRMSVFRLLVRRAPDWVPAGEISSALSLKASTLSVYVSILAREGIVRSMRSGRSILYSVDLDRFGSLLDFLARDCCRGRPEVREPLLSRSLAAERGEARSYNVLFVCTRNSARSIFAEAILSDLGGERFQAFSAGTEPGIAVSGHAMDVLRRMGHETGSLSPKSIHDLIEPAAPRMDFVITVCNNAANSGTPALPGQPFVTHWGMSDPAAVEGDRETIAESFLQTYRLLRRRLEIFTAMPIASLEPLDLQREIDAIGQIDAPATEASSPKV